MGFGPGSAAMVDGVHADPDDDRRFGVSGWGPVAGKAVIRRSDDPFTVALDLYRSPQGDVDSALVQRQAAEQRVRAFPKSGTQRDFVAFVHHSPDNAFPSAYHSLIHFRSPPGNPEEHAGVRS